MLPMKPPPLLSQDFSASLDTPQGSSGETCQETMLHFMVAHNWYMRRGWVHTNELNGTQAWRQVGAQDHPCCETVGAISGTAFSPGDKPCQE